MWVFLSFKGKSNDFKKVLDKISCDSFTQIVNLLIKAEIQSSNGCNVKYPAKYINRKYPNKVNFS